MTPPVLNNDKRLFKLGGVIHLVDPIGIEPTTLRMRTVRSPRLSYGPKSTVPKAEQKKQYEIIRCGRKPNPLRSQLSYGPILAIFHRKKL